MHVGLAVSSHVDGTLATAVFDNVSVDQALMTSSRDLGSVGYAGSTTFDGVVYEVKASGADIWGTADAFRLVRGPGLPMSGNHRARAQRGRTRTPGPKRASCSAVAGSPTSPHVMVVVTPGKGVAMQYRPTTAAQSVQVAVSAGVAPEWVRLTQADGTFKGYTSEDGVTWQLFGSVTLAMDRRTRPGGDQPQQRGADHGGVRERAIAVGR